MKASNTGRFVTGFYQKYRNEAMAHPDSWVLYWVKRDGEDECFVLSHAEMATAQAARNSTGAALTWEQNANAFSKGVDNALAADLEMHSSAWELASHELV